MSVRSIVSCCTFFIIIVHGCHRTSPVIYQLIVYVLGPVAVHSHIHRNFLTILKLKSNLSKIWIPDMMFQLIKLLLGIVNEHDIRINAVHILQKLMVIHISMTVPHIFLLRLNGLLPILNILLSIGNIPVHLTNCPVKKLIFLLIV